MYRSHNCGDLRMDHVGQEVVLSGWVQISRDLGGLTFVDLRDRYGITQLFFSKETTSDELFEKARTLGREFVVRAKGKVVERHFSKSVTIPWETTRYWLINFFSLPCRRRQSLIQPPPPPTKMQKKSPLN